MSRRQKNPLRALTTEERQWLQRITRSTREPATHVARAKQLLAVAAGYSYTEAAQRAGRRSGDAVAHLVERFTREGAQAIEPRAGGGPKPKYGLRERERILAAVRRAPEPETDGTATWSLMTLRRALRRAPDGLPQVSTYTIRAVLHDAGFRWPHTRTWCETGVTMRKRKSGAVVKVVDPDAVPKKT
jgi:transposase